MSLSLLQKEVERLAKTAGGTLGVCAIHIETGRQVAVFGDERFPMASVFKIPLALHLLNLVDQGNERLDRMIELKAHDLHPGSGAISHILTKPGVSLSLLNLLELTMTISDNTATDVIMREIGGHQPINCRLCELGIEGIRVDRPTVHLIQDVAGLKLPHEKNWTPEVFEKADKQADRMTPKAKRKIVDKFNADPRDTSTPNGMAVLLARLWKEELLSPQSTKLLLDIMGRCQTGLARLKGLLPAETEVMHKTGTLMTVIQSTTNDAGIVTLPDNAGHIAIAAFVKSSEKTADEQDRAIAEVTRAAHDYFLFNNGQS